MSDPIDEPAPIRRADCAGVARPCPWTRCRHHALHDSARDIGVHLSRMRKHRTAEATCTLDVADMGGITQGEVAEFLGVGYRQVIQIEHVALRKVRRAAIRLGLG